MKDMVYSTEAKRKVLDSGYCLGFFYYILSLGYHPTAYIRIPENHKLYGKDYFEIEDMGIDIDVHGGLSYARDYLFLENHQTIEGWFIGWDYNHFGDYSGSFKYRQDFADKKWTTEEIKREVTDVCYQLNHLEDKEVNHE